MEALRCPQCRALSYPGLMGFPHCHRCHEQLRQCRYCTHQSGGLCQLDAAGRPPLQEDEGKPFCAAYDSRLLAEPERPPWSRHWANFSGLALVVVLTAMIGNAVARRAAESPPQIEAESNAADVTDGRVEASFLVETPHDNGPLVTVLLDASVFKYYYEAEPPEPLPLPAKYPPGEEPRYTFQLAKDDTVRFTLSFMPKPDAPASVPLTVSLLADEQRPISTATTYLINHAVVTH
jgi:hypothetical protein